MAKRALLIGSQTFGLTGVNGDVELMAESLSERGFDVMVKLDDEATREGILDAYEQLITDTPPGSTDPVVVYYSGHGGRDPFGDWEERQRRGELSHLQYIVPFDMAATTESDYRGLLAQELSALQSRLTERTTNVTTILDCCHSATMSRGRGALMPKAVSRSFPTAGAVSVLERLGPSRDGWDTSNRLAVRIVACDPTQSAYERASVLGGRHGALTEQLVLALRELGGRSVSWRWIGDRIRTRVSAEIPMQRPEVEGPSERVIFSLDTRSAVGAVPVSKNGTDLTIEPADLFGASEGDRFQLVDSDGATVARATVTEVSDDRAHLTVESPLAADAAELIAVPVRTAVPRPVRLDVAQQLAEPLTAKIAASSLLRVLDDDGDPGDGEPGEPPAVAIIGEKDLTVRDGSGAAINRDALPTDDAGQNAAVALAERVVKADRLRRLRSADADGERDRLVRVEFFQHDGSGRTPRDLAGVRFHPGDRISVGITNITDVPVYVGLFDIDLASRVVLLSQEEPFGWRLEPGETKVAGGTGGVALSWDETVPDDEERLETLVVIAATKPQEFTLLETAKDGATRRGAPLSELESLLTEAATGTRNWGAGSSTADTPRRYSADTVDFFMSPDARSDLREPSFAITDLPPLSMRTSQPRGPLNAPSRAAVRLVALKVRNNKALFRAAVRVDALVMTMQADGNVVAQPFTFRFPGIQDGDLLPMDKLQLYLGDVHEFLDIAIWVNRDDTKGVDLAKLFEQAADDTTTQGALTVIGGLVLAAPQVAIAVGTVAAVATVVRVGSELVQAAVGKEIGLYRTSFLAFEKFGVGRQPAEGLRQAQGIEFAYEIIDISGDGGA